MPLARWAWRRRLPRARGTADAAVTIMRTLARPGEITVVDDRGADYALRPQGGSGRVGPSGEPVEPRSVRFWLDPVPRREVGWLELRGQDGAATRLLPSARPAVQVGQLTPVAVSPAERELTDQALSLVELQLTSTGEPRKTSSGSIARPRWPRWKRSGDPASVAPPASYQTNCGNCVPCSPSTAQPNGFPPAGQACSTRCGEPTGPGISWTSGLPCRPSTAWSYWPTA